MEILQKLNDKDNKSLFGWRERVFPIEGKNIDWCRPSHHLVYRDNGEAVGHIGFLRATVTSEEKEFSVVGIGGVCVNPRCQGTGITRLMFAYLHEVAPGITGTGAFTLFCPFNLEAYYQKLGYSRYPWHVTVRQQGRQQAIEFLLMVYQCDQINGPLSIYSEPW